MASFPGLLFIVCENTQTKIERPVNKAMATQIVSFLDPLYGPAHVPYRGSTWEWDCYELKFKIVSDVITSCYTAEQDWICTSKLMASTELPLFFNHSTPQFMQLFNDHH